MSCCPRHCATWKVGVKWPVLKDNGKRVFSMGSFISLFGLKSSWTGSFTRKHSSGRDINTGICCNHCQPSGPFPRGPHPLFFVNGVHNQLLATPVLLQSLQSECPVPPHLEHELACSGSAMPKPSPPSCKHQTALTSQI